MAHSSELSTQHASATGDVRLQPVAGLEWSLAAEDPPPSGADGASDWREPSPASVRRSWIHTAPEHRVVQLYRKLCAAGGSLPAPWWLRALARDELPSRNVAFEFEDAVHDALERRGGWVFVPWVAYGETGYWEYAPSDREPMKVPTTVLCTDEHNGWLSVLPAHGEDEPATRPLERVDGLLEALPRVETW